MMGPSAAPAPSFAQAWEASGARVWAGPAGSEQALRGAHRSEVWRAAAVITAISTISVGAVLGAAKGYQSLRPDSASSSASDSPKLGAGELSKIAALIVSDPVAARAQYRRALTAYELLPSEQQAGLKGPLVDLAGKVLPVLHEHVGKSGTSLSMDLRDIERTLKLQGLTVDQIAKDPGYQKSTAAFSSNVLRDVTSNFNQLSNLDSKARVTAAQPMLQRLDEISPFVTPGSRKLFTDYTMLRSTVEALARGEQPDIVAPPIKPIH